MPKEVATIVELSIKPIIINILWPFLLGIFLVPILTRIFLRIPATETIRIIISNSDDITNAKFVAGIPKILSIMSYTTSPSFIFIILLALPPT